MTRSEPHARTTMICDLCERVWEAVYPLSAYDEAGECRLECPGCGFEVAAPGLSLVLGAGEDGGGGVAGAIA